MSNPHLPRSVALTASWRLTSLVALLLLVVASESAAAAGLHSIRRTAAATAVRLPQIPDVVHPPTVTGIQETAEEDDPEQRPGLFQGDIAIDPVSHRLWKVGLRYVRASEVSWHWEM